VRDGTCDDSGSMAWAETLLAGRVWPVQSDDRLAGILDRFLGFLARGHGLAELGDVTPNVAEAFVRSPLPDGSVPSVGVMHLRRSAVRLLFRAAREAGWPVGDPTLDLALPPRSPLSCRALTDDEVALCRGHAMWSLSGARRASAWALAEATCRSRELGHIRVSDVDLEAGRLWVHGGRQTAPRWGMLSDWGKGQVARRVNELAGEPAARLVYSGGRGDRVGQVSSCLAIDDVLTRSGLKAEPDVRPSSIAAWAGRKVFEETGRIDEVARHLGMASLDRAAGFIGWDWRPCERVG